MAMELKNKNLKTDMMLTDAELDLIAGGELDWYYRSDKAELEDGTVVEGYLLEAENKSSGTTVATRFIAKKDFERFKKAHRDDNFFYGYLKPTV